MNLRPPGHNVIVVDVDIKSPSSILRKNVAPPFSMVKEEVEKDMTFTFNDKFSLWFLPSRTKINHVITESNFISGEAKMSAIGRKLKNHSIFTTGESLKNLIKRNAMREKQV
jgi:hypothetical protein